MPLLEIVLVVVTGAMTFAFTLLAKKIDRKEDAAYKRQQQHIETQIVEMKYTRSIGSLAYYTAQSVRNANDFPIGTGELNDAMRYFKDKEHELEDFYQKMNAEKNS